MCGFQILTCHESVKQECIINRLKLKRSESNRLVPLSNSFLSLNCIVPKGPIRSLKKYPGIEPRYAIKARKTAIFNLFKLHLIANSCFFVCVLANKKRRMTHQKKPLINSYTYVCLVLLLP